MTLNQWRNGWAVITGLRDGERVALSNANRFRWRVEGQSIYLDRDISMPCVISGAEPRLEYHDDSMGLVIWSDITDKVGPAFTLGQTLDIGVSKSDIDTLAKGDAVRDLRKVITRLVDRGSIDFGTDESRTLIAAARVLGAFKDA